MGRRGRGEEGGGWGRGERGEKEAVGGVEVVGWACVPSRWCGVCALARLIGTIRS